MSIGVGCCLTNGADSIPQWGVSRHPKARCAKPNLPPAILPEFAGSKTGAAPPAAQARGCAAS